MHNNILPSELFSMGVTANTTFLPCRVENLFPLNFVHVSTKTILINYGKHIYTMCFTCVKQGIKVILNHTFNRNSDEFIFQ